MDMHWFVSFIAREKNCNRLLVILLACLYKDSLISRFAASEDWQGRICCTTIHTDYRLPVFPVPSAMRPPLSALRGGEAAPDAGHRHFSVTTISTGLSSSERLFANASRASFFNGYFGSECKKACDVICALRSNTSIHCISSLESAIIWG